MIHFRYTSNYDDFVGIKSKKSVVNLNEVFFKLITEVSPCDLFIEAGAFDGTTSLLVQKAMPRAQVYAFEANPYNYAKFKSSFENNAVNYMHLAVSNQTGNTTFKVQKEREGVSIPQIKGNNSILARTDHTVSYENVTVPCVRLDDYFAGKYDSNNCIGMWIDLEGFAYQALSGAKNLLDCVSVLKVEVESYQYWKEQKLDQDVCEFLTIQGFIPILRDFEYQQQYNILFCKPSVVNSPKFQTLIDTYRLTPNQ
jgi:FkbM family methyltransferase